MAETARMLWSEFIDLRPDTPAPDGSQLKMTAVVGVLLLRVMLWFLIVTPIGWRLIWQTWLWASA